MPRRCGPFTLLELVAEGGVGAVWRGQDDDGREVAIKVLHTVAPHAVASLQREVHVLMGLHHPGVVKVVDQGTDAGKPWMAMELVRGQTLRDRMGRRAEHHTWSPEGDDVPAVMEVDRDLLRIVGELAQTLAWLHGEGVVHRDVKPENVIVRDGHPVLVDFGLAAVSSTRDAIEPLAGGTPAYMAPEQARREPVDARADVYALGALLHEVVVGRAPLHGPEPVDDPALEALFDEILAQDRWAREGAAGAVADWVGLSPATPPARTCLFRPPLVGRGELLADLTRILDQGGGAVVLAGSSGCGKTRIAMELAAEARRRRWAVLSGRGHDGQPLAGFRSVIGAARRRARRSSDTALDAMVAELSSPKSRTGQLQAMVEVVRALCRTRPLLVFLDDLHAAHPTTEDLTVALARAIRAEGLPVLLITTWRTAEVPLSARARREFDPIEIGDLGGDALGALAAGLLGTTTSPARLSSFLRRHAAGNALLAIELTRAVLEGGQLVRASGQWELRQTTSLDHVSVEALATLRLAQLPGPTQQLAHAAAVAGDDLDDEGIRAVTGLDASAFARALHRARLAGFLEAEAGGLAFTHGRLRSATYDGIDPRERQRLHRAVAARVDPERSVDHWLAAGDRQRAHEACLEAARPRLAQHVGGVSPLLERAVELIEDPSASLLLTLAMAANLDGRLEVAERAARSVLRHADAREQCQAHIELSRTCRHTSAAETALSHADEAIRMATTHAWPPERARANLERAWALNRSKDRWEEALRNVAAGLSLARSLGDGHLIARGLRIRGDILVKREQWAQAIDAYETALDAAGAGMAPVDRCALLGNLGAACFGAQDIDGALRFTMQNLEQALDMGFLPSALTCMVNLGILHVQNLETDTAARLFGGAATVSVRLGDWTGAVSALAQWATVLSSCLRDHEASRDLTRRLLRDGGPWLRPDARMRCWRTLSLAHLRLGDHRTVLAMADEDGPMGRPDGMCVRLARTMAGDVDPAETASILTNPDFLEILAPLLSDPGPQLRQMWTTSFQTTRFATQRRQAVAWGAEGLPPARELPLLPARVEAMAMDIRPLIPGTLAELDRLQRT